MMIFQPRSKEYAILLKPEKQIGGTIYRPILAVNKAQHQEGVGLPCWMQTSTTRWLRGWVSSFNNRRLCLRLYSIFGTNSFQGNFSSECT